MINKRLTCSLAFIAAFFTLSSAWADNTEYTPTFSVNADNFNQSFSRNMYLDINFGYAAVNWNQFTPAQTFVINRNSRGGFTFGADTGYQFNKNLSMELGWAYLPEVKYTTPANVRFTVQSWFAYFGFKVWLPVTAKFYFFGKLLASYRYLDFTSSPSGVLPDGRHPLWRPAGAIGWQYNITSSWAISMQYLYAYGRDSNGTGAVIAPEINLITVAYSYRFQV